MNGDAYERVWQLSAHARKLRSECEFEEAASYHISAAHWRFSGIRHLPDELSDRFETTYHLQAFVAQGVQEVLAACLCFRFAGKESRAQTHCEMGSSVVSDVMNHEDRFASSRNRARLGLAHEMLGDLRLFADRDDYKHKYSQAVDIYESVNSYKGWQAEDEFNALIQPVLELADAIGYHIEPEMKDGIVRTSLPARATFKQNHYQQIIEQVLEQGGWESDLF